ncbi:MAG: helicase HerA-like C-terminal domain-containing protein [Pseudomonadota bacterium]
MASSDRIFVGGGGVDYAEPQSLLLKYANRHGLIAGATGTGKTVTLQILAESFSNAGVPVFLADVKGDLSGLAEAGSPAHKLHDKLIARAETIGFEDYDYDDFPVVFWDVFGKQGHPVRTTVTEMGPLLLARLMELNDTQEGILNIAFAVAEDEGLALLDLKDLQAMLVFLGENAAELSLQYGNVSKASIGAIQRRLLVLDNQGAEAFFGEPALELSDMIATTPDGRGRINVLAADQLMHNPRLYATLLLWMLSELWEELPEVGDPDKPKFVFFFDEAHLLFEDAPKVLLEKVEQVARLIRSKGVGVYFISQNPADVPDDILGQLGNRVQHALRAFTPRDRKALRAAAQTFRQNPDFDTEEAISQVGVGEALVSCLEAKGAPSMVHRTLIRPPSSKLGPCSGEVRAKTLRASPVAGLYDQALDRESAYEKLKVRAEKRAAATDSPGMAESGSRGRRYSAGHSPKPKKRASKRGDSAVEAMMKSAMRSAGTQIGRSVVKSLLRGLFR